MKNINKMNQKMKKIKNINKIQNIMNNIIINVQNKNKIVIKKIKKLILNRYNMK